MNIKTRIARLERATDDLPVASQDYDPSDLGQFLTEYFLMIEANPEHFAERDRSLDQQIADYERRVEAKNDYPGVLQTMDMTLPELRRKRDTRAALMEYRQAELTGIDPTPAIERFHAVAREKWMLDLHHLPPLTAHIWNEHCERVGKFWDHFWNNPTC